MFSSLLRMMRWRVYPSRLYWKHTKKEQSLTSGCANVPQQRGCGYERVSCRNAHMVIQVKKWLSDAVPDNRRLSNGGVDLQVPDWSGCLMRHGETNPENTTMTGYSRC